MPTTTLLSLALVVSFLAVLPERWWMRAAPVAVFIGVLLVAGLSTTIRGPIVLVALLAWGGLLHSKTLRWGWAIANTLILGGTVAATHRLVFETHACQAESLPAARASEGLDGEIPGPPSPVLHLVHLPTEIDGPAPSVPAAAALVATRHGEAWRATASGQFSFQLRDDLCERRARGAGPFAILDAWVEAQISEAARFDAAHVRDQGGVGSDELEMLELLGYVE